MNYEYWNMNIEIMNYEYRDLNCIEFKTNIIVFKEGLRVH